MAEFGDPVAVYNNLRRGDYRNGALAALGMFAGPEDLIKNGFRKGIKILPKMFGI